MLLLLAGATVVGGVAALTLQEDLAVVVIRRQQAHVRGDPVFVEQGGVGDLAGQSPRVPAAGYHRVLHLLEISVRNTLERETQDLQPGRASGRATHTGFVKLFLKLF